MAESSISFLSMFPAYEPPEPLQSLLAQAVILDAEIDAESRSLSVRLFSPDYLPMNAVEEIAGGIRTCYAVAGAAPQPSGDRAGENAAPGADDALRP